LICPLVGRTKSEYLPLLAVTVTILVANWTAIRGLRTELKADIHRLEGKMENLRKELKNTRPLSPAGAGANAGAAAYRQPVGLRGS